MSEVSDVLGVAPSTAHRLLTSLKAQGFAEQASRNGHYLPGPVLREIGQAALNSLDVRRAARPALEQLSRATGETVSLGVLEGYNVRFLDGIESTRTVRVGDRTGVLMPAHATAAGKAIMAALSDFELERRSEARGLERRTADTVTGWQDLREELAAIRRAGYALNVGEVEQGVSAVSAVVTDILEAPAASINVVLPSSRMPDKRSGRGFVTSVKVSAAAASAAVRSWAGPLPPS